jgi:hypothetical protein
MYFIALSLFICQNIELNDEVIAEKGSLIDT